jgi:hypothetical protein
VDAIPVGRQSMVQSLVLTLRRRPRVPIEMASKPQENRNKAGQIHQSTGTWLLTLRLTISDLEKPWNPMERIKGRLGLVLVFFKTEKKQGHFKCLNST